jgi:hypothetical protein
MLKSGYAMLLAAWFGALASIALWFAPMAFAHLPRPTAGMLMGRVFAVEAALSCGVAMLALLMHRRLLSDAADRAGLEAPPRQLTPELLMLAGVLFCTVAGYYGLQPSMERARAGGPGLSFGALHAVSSAFFAAKAMLVGVLAWRGTRSM